MPGHRGSCFKNEPVLDFPSGCCLTHHRLCPASGVGKQSVQADDPIGLPRDADVDHCLGGRHCMELGGPEPFRRGGAGSTPGPATGGFTC